MTDYVDIREIHPDYQKAPCRYEDCDAEEWVPTRALINRDYTVCDECSPLSDSDRERMFGPEVTVRL